MLNYNILLTACTKFNKMSTQKQKDFFYLLAYAYSERKDFSYPLNREMSIIDMSLMPEYVQNMFVNFTNNIL